MQVRPRTALVSLAALFATPVSIAGGAGGQGPSPEASLAPSHGATGWLDCAYRSHDEWLAELRAAVTRGEVPDPATRALPTLPIRERTPGSAGAGCPLSPAHVFPYEDSAGVLLTDFSTGQLLDLMVDAANALLATHGDIYDFLGYWVNFTPHHLIGAAFYAGIENDVQGLGLGLFDHRAGLGLAGSNVEGFVMMWDVRAGHWQAGTGPGADFTRLALAQEFEHRFAMFLPNLADGRSLQGNDASCGRSAHWNWRVDGQGSGMEISEWVGSNPALLVGSFVTFNTDIVGGVFSYPDLYLMGYVSPTEMDSGVSELRYMNLSNCSATHNGTITTFGSADIVATAGPRIPDSSAAQKHFRTGWIMLHQPGNPPTPTQLSKAVGILEQHQVDWEFSTLGRGTMDDSLFDDCNCNQVPDADDIGNGGSSDGNGNGVPDECECSAVNYCTALPNSTGSPAVISSSGSLEVSDNGFVLESSACPGGRSGIFYFGPERAQIPFGNGNRCVSGGVVRLALTSTNGVGEASFPVDLTSPPAAGRLVAGSSWDFQFWFRDPAGGGAAFNLSDGLEVVFCP